MHNKETRAAIERVMLNNPSLSPEQAEKYAIKTLPEVMDHLEWCSYKANRGYGCTHEQLLSIGIGNESMRLRYEKVFPTSNPLDHE